MGKYGVCERIKAVQMPIRATMSRGVGELRLSEKCDCVADDKTFCLDTAQRGRQQSRLMRDARVLRTMKADSNNYYLNFDWCRNWGLMGPRRCEDRAWHGRPAQPYYACSH